MHSIHMPAAGRWTWLSLIGPDAQDFLHRLTTADARNLVVGEGARACFLTAQGKLRAYFTLWNYRPTEFALEFDSGSAGEWKRSLLAAIDQYTFTEKMTLAEVPNLAFRWIFAEPGREADLLARIGAPELKPMQTSAIDEEIRVCHHGEIDYGRPWITVWGRPERLRQWLDRALPEVPVIDESSLEQMRIRALRPHLGAELTLDTIPLEAGLVDSIAPFKGCYPGQEVIERMVSLGAPARRLSLIEGTGHSPVVGAKITNEAAPPAEVGKVTSVLNTEGGFIALGYIRKIHAKEGLGVRFEGTEATGTLKRIAPYATN